VIKHDLAVHLRAIGTVSPVNTVTVRSRVEGQLLKVAFTEGQEVAVGQLLAEIDPTPYRLRLAQMEGQLRQSESQARTAQSDLERFKQLHAQTLISSQQLEGQQALVAERLGVLAAEQAQVEDARRQLAYTRIEAPIAGRLGLRQVDAGNLVRPGEAGGLVVITQTRPIAVMFTIPELDLQKVLEPLRAGEPLAVEAWDRGENVVLATGALKTVDNQIDLATGTLRLKAEFANTDERLFPNQFVNVRLRVRTLKDATVIPAVAVQYGSRGPYAYIVGAENKVAVRDLVLGPIDGAMQAVTKGVAPGDVVVTEGVDRLREGRVVSLISGDSAPPAPPAAPGAPDGAKKKKKSGS
jgi:multidrug efflux system membrane fusion protein